MFISCDSSLISQYAYNASEWVLSLTLRGTGETRHYQEVSPEIYDDMLKAPSLGRFVGANIFNKYKVLLDSDIPAEAREERVEQGDKFEDVIDDERIRYKPQTAVALAEPQLADVMPPEQIAELAPKSPKMDAVDKMAAELLALLAKPLPAIENQQTYELVQLQVAAVKKGVKQFDDTVNPFVKIAYAAYKTQFDKQASVDKPAKEFVDRENRRLNAYEAKLEADRVERQRKAQEEADRLAEEERQRRSQELTLAAASDALAEGDNVRAEMLFDTPLEAPPVPAYAPRIEPGYQAVSGTSKRKNWSAEVVNMEDLILDIAEGIKRRRAGKDIAGHAPSTWLLPNGPALNQQAKASEDTKRFPGVLFKNEPVRSSRNR